MLKIFNKHAWNQELLVIRFHLIKQTFYSSLWLAVASLNMTTTAVN
jgi:hypothetical protein